MKLIIAEKSIAGSRIASILAERAVSTSLEQKAQLFEFRKGAEDFMVIPLRGHIVNVDFPKQYSYWVGTDLRKLIEVNVEYIETEKNIAALLRKKSKEAEEIIIATDADREGEAIGVEALEFCKKSNPKMKISRAYFSAITPTDINNAFSNLAKVDYNFADSANARREIDLIWGAILTRFLSLVSGRLGAEFLSVGRVQSPTLALIVGREKERNAFEVKKYWELKAVFEKDKQKFEAFHKKGRFWEKAEAEKALSKKAPKGIVVRVEKKQRVLAKPLPFNTTSFLRAATAIGFGAGEAMNVAESLYMNGFISYPRTDNTVYPATLNLKTILNELLKNSEFFPLAKRIIEAGKLSPSRGKAETKDHPPIHPVASVPKNKLSEREWRIYELVVRRFLATLAEEALTENLVVEIDLNKEPYIANGQRILKAGWKEFYPYSVLTETILPELKKGDEVILIKLDLLQKETQPPSRYSQGTLIKLMEELGLGTKSTRHEIIKKLFSRHYVVGVKAIVPNKISFAVIDSLEKFAPKVTKPKMTSELEKEMDSIAAGKKTKKEVVQESKDFLKEILDDLIKNKDEIGKELRKALEADSIMGNCPNCKGQLRILKSRNNKRFLACNQYPKCKTTFPLPQKGKILFVDKICSFCKKPVFKVIGHRYSFEMCVDPNCESKKDWKKKEKK